MHRIVSAYENKLVKIHNNGIYKWFTETYVDPTFPKFVQVVMIILMIITIIIIIIITI